MRYMAFCVRLDVYLAGYEFWEVGESGSEGLSSLFDAERPHRDTLRTLSWFHLQGVSTTRRFPRETRKKRSRLHAHFLKQIDEYLLGPTCYNCVQTKHLELGGVEEIRQRIRWK